MSYVGRTIGKIFICIGGYCLAKLAIYRLEGGKSIKEIYNEVKDERLRNEAERNVLDDIVLQEHDFTVN